MGGDLSHFMSLIRAGDREGLFQYGKSCIDILYPFSVSYDLPFTSIGLIRGEALGGGFEIALASKVLIAEKSARFGFPETMFGLFPGMGAFSFLARKLTPSLAKRMIASGKVYTADELYEMGVVDQVVEDGCGEEAVYSYIKNQRERMVGMHGFDRVIDEFNPVSYEELIRVVDIWADTALQLSERNLRVMAYLVRAQNKRWLGRAGENLPNERESSKQA
jgi:DSF synthase